MTKTDTDFETLAGNFMLSLMSAGYSLPEIFEGLQKTVAMIYHNHTQEIYPEISDQLTVKLFADCSVYYYRKYLREKKGF